MILHRSGTATRILIFMAYRRHKISLVIPCLNEEAGLAAVLARKPEFVDEVIVVDNGSTDATALVAHKHGARVIHLAEKGYGRAYRCGLPAAAGDIIAIMDGDDSYPVERLADFLEPIAAEKLDFVAGSRFPLESKASMPWIKRAANRFMAWLAGRRLGLRVRDTQTGMCAFRRALLGRILPEDNGMAFSQALKFNAWLDPAVRSAEIQIPYRPRVGRVKFRTLRDSLETVAHLLRYRVRMPAAGSA
jgi:glycosyltransferase involved in cell wall biosynthesis